jgi:hypothetical protein
MVRTLPFGTALQSATFAAITMAYAQPGADPDVLPPDITDLDN